MKYYFKLRYRILLRMLSENRMLSDIGMSPKVAFILGISVFLYLSRMLFVKTEYAEYIYTVFAAYYIFMINKKSRCDFLRLCFSNKSYYQVRFIENLIIALPFLIYLFYEGEFYMAFSLVGVSIILTIVKTYNRFSFVIPTPFFRYPFEFTAGFRRSIIFYLLTCFIAFKGVEVGNPNLGPISITFVILICCSYYLVNENIFLVWVHAVTAKEFLVTKIITSLRYFTILVAPVFLLMLVYFPDKYGVLIGACLLGYLSLPFMVLLKYSAYPEGLGLVYGFILSLVTVFPLMLLFIAPLLYSQSLKRLMPVLE